MKRTYIIFIFFFIAAISVSSGDEVHNDDNNNGSKGLSSSYTYSIEYSDDNNSGKYGHKIEVKDGSAKVNVHAQHPQIVSTPKQQRTIQQKKPANAKPQEVSHVQAQELQGAVLQHQASPVIQNSQAQPASTVSNLPINTLDKQQLALLLTQNKNPFFPLTESKGLKSTQQISQAPVQATKYLTVPQSQPTVSYYTPQDQNVKDYSSQQIGNIKQAVKSSNAYAIDPKQQYTYQYQPNAIPSTNKYASNLVYDPKIQHASVQNQQNLYYPSTSANNQKYQNYYQLQVPTSAHTSSQQPQVQYTVPFTQNQPAQQYVYVQPTGTASVHPQQQQHLTQFLAGSQYGTTQSSPSHTSVPQSQHLVHLLPSSQYSASQPSSSHSAIPHSTQPTQLSPGTKYSIPQSIPQPEYLTQLLAGSQYGSPQPSSFQSKIPQSPQPAQLLTGTKYSAPQSVPHSTVPQSEYLNQLFANSQYGASQSVPHSTIPQSQHLSQLLAGSQYGGHQTSNQVGPVQFLPQYTTPIAAKPQFTHIPSTQSYQPAQQYINGPKGVQSIASGPGSYPTTIFTNSQHGQAASKPIVEPQPPTGSANSYPNIQGIYGSNQNYASGAHQGIDLNTLLKQSSLNLNSQGGKSYYNLAQPNQGTPFKASFQIPNQEFAKLDYSQTGANINQGKEAAYAQISKSQSSLNYIPSQQKPNLQYYTPKSGFTTGSSNIQPNAYYSADNSNKYYAPATASSDNSNIRYIYVPNYSAQQTESKRN